MSFFESLSNNLPKPKDTWTTSEIILWKLLNGQTCIGKEKIDLTNAIKTLTVPIGCTKAILSIEADDSSADKAKVARFYETGDIPNATDGMPLGDNNVYEIIGETNLSNFKLIGIEAGKTHTVQIQYFSY